LIYLALDLVVLPLVNVVICGHTVTCKWRNSGVIEI
jgi:hypothetical protein